MSKTRPSTVSIPQQKILVLSTGGTIEKSYDEIGGELLNRETTIKKGILQRLRLPYTQIEVKSLMSKDSLDLDDQDRGIILKAIDQFSLEKNPIVVLHGTDTLEITVEWCCRYLQAAKVPIIFTGAMRPSDFLDSDAFQNTVESLLAAKILKPGIYLSFHNQIFPAPHFRKNKELGTFEYFEKTEFLPTN